MTPVVRAGADVLKTTQDIVGSRICVPSEKLPYSADVDHAAFSMRQVFRRGAIIPIPRDSK
jgi:hypothetical protein